jgi:hypothetical protein
VAWLGFLSYLGASNVQTTTYNNLVNWLKKHADTIVARTNNDAFSFNLRTWGSNPALLNNAMILKKAWDIYGNIAYKEALIKNIDYILGKNITGYSFITGYGFKKAKNIDHIYLKNDTTMLIPHGILVGGPSANQFNLPLKYPPNTTYDIYLLYFDTCDAQAKRYLDIPNPGYYKNEPAIDYNARLLYALYALLPTIPSNSENFTLSRYMFYVYPNPNKGRFFIELNRDIVSSGGNVNVCVYNITGQKIWQKKTGNSNFSFEIDLSEYSSGVYIVSVETEKQYAKQKIILMR